MLYSYLNALFPTILLCNIFLKIAVKPRNDLTAISYSNNLDVFNTEYSHHL